MRSSVGGIAPAPFDKPEKLTVFSYSIFAFSRFPVNLDICLFLFVSQ